MCWNVEHSTLCVCTQGGIESSRGPFGTSAGFAGRKNTCVHEEEGKRRKPILSGTDHNTTTEKNKQLTYGLTISIYLDESDCWHTSIWLLYVRLWKASDFLIEGDFCIYRGKQWLYSLNCPLSKPSYRSSWKLLNTQHFIMWSCLKWKNPIHFSAADGQIFGTGQRPSEGNDSVLDRMVCHW